MNKKSDTNWGCLIVVILGIIGYLIYYFSTESPESIYSTGVSIIGTIIVVGLYFFVKYIINNTQSGQDTKNKVNYKNKTNVSMRGCILSIIAIIGGISLYFWLTNDGNLTYGIGTTIIVIAVIGLGIWVYISFKDE